jgi:hypothetical protein
VRRFVVVEESMLPALRPGDGLIATRSRRIRRGQVRVFEHPQRPGFWLVKRVGAIREATFDACSDNDAPGVVDSRRFGPVPIDGSYRVRWRIPARWIRGA